MAQAVKYLPFKQEDPSSIPRGRTKSKSMVAHTWNSSPEEQETGGSLGSKVYKEKPRLRGMDGWMDGWKEGRREGRKR